MIQASASLLRLAVVLFACASLWLMCVPSTLAASARHCPGRVELTAGDSASRIIAKNIGCMRAKRVIKAPAPTRGYTCTNPFDRPRGSGGFIRCRKGSVRIRFLYSQS